ncbi:bifunctional 3-(3-hydroxy-phenyl)propionate/3-hydroxycinnamic acid hydroxylase [Nocardia aobensis]|uniref:bifunctional 3-(3-hydroxy-phenyl)propionate/3-hydroxycinnamic acid hydroxylase n=1 Tax=Nocardia aobensis TaxID=257277 RepID=UPI0003001467|nr:bifunctional 3-(3-hydroxy-phenyl)propionate/3-hydroxycinnamic acid hydroxylase [Nocardia aobensis]
MTTTPSPVTVEVAICGAGPVGLTAAALLAARGVGVVVLEQNDATSDEPKAISIDDESLRVYQQAGIVDAILPIVVPGTGTRYYDRHGKPLFHARGARPYRLGYPFKNPFAQPDLERALLNAVESRPGVELRFGTKVTGFQQLSDRVRIRTECGGEADTVDAAFVLGCDGGRSATRLLQGVDMTGRSYGDVWLVVDTVDDDHTERFAMHHGDPDRPHVVVPGLNGRCRYEFRLFPGEGEAGAPPSFELIRQLVSRYRELAPHQVERAVNYRFNAVVADEWMIGRSFLLGDAAHMMPPFAGQGLNSGVRDAANLTWKIADVLAGRLDSRILSSYHSERAPHAWATVRMSERLGRVVMTTSPHIAARRDELARSAMAAPAGRAFLEEMRYRPAQHYTHGMVFAPAPETAGAVGVPIGQPLAFDVRDHAVRRLDDVLGNGWALLGVDVGEQHWEPTELISELLAATEVSVVTADRLPRTARQVLVDVDGALIEEFRSYTGQFVLLRPDRFVAAAWHPGDSDRVAAQVRSWTPDVEGDLASAGTPVAAASPVVATK